MLDCHDKYIQRTVTKSKTCGTYFATWQGNATPFIMATMTNNSTNNSMWTSEPMTLSFFASTHGICKPKMVKSTDEQGITHVYHSIDAGDGASALFSKALEAELEAAKLSGQQFKLDQSKLVIRSYHNTDSQKSGFMAYYQNKQETDDFAL